MHSFYNHNAVAIYECIDDFVKLFQEVLRTTHFFDS